MDVYALFAVSDIRSHLIGVFDALSTAQEAGLTFTLAGDWGEPYREWGKVVRTGPSGRNEAYYQQYERGRTLKVQRFTLNSISYS